MGIDIGISFADVSTERQIPAICGLDVSWTIILNAANQRLWRWHGTEMLLSALTGLGFGNDFDYSHICLAFGTDGDIEFENVFEKPGPGMPSARCLLGWLFTVTVRIPHLLLLRLISLRGVNTHRTPQMPPDDERLSEKLQN